MLSSPTLTSSASAEASSPPSWALMASEDAFDRTPDCAIFADTHWEPPSIYEHLEWLKDRLSFPLYVVDNGRSLRDDVKALTNHSGSRNYVDIPVYLKGRDGEGDGIGRRQCTDNYKIRPIKRRIRGLLGLRPRKRVPAGTSVELWLGISTDEGHTHEDIPRQVDDEPLPPHRGGHVPEGLHGLVGRPLRQAPGTLGLRRLPLPVTTAVGRRRSAGWPELFAEAVEIDARLRDGLAFAKEPYLHNLRMPLAKAVALGEAEAWGRRAKGRVRQRVRGSLWRLRGRPHREVRHGLRGIIGRCHTKP